MHRKKSYSRGDLIVYYEITIEEHYNDDGSEGLGLENVTPMCLLAVGTYLGYEPIMVDGEDESYCHVKTHASVDYTAHNISGIVTVYGYSDYMDPQFILGCVSGKLDTKDLHAVRRYLRLVWKRYFPFFLDKLSQESHALLQDEEISRQGHN